MKKTIVLVLVSSTKLFSQEWIPSNATPSQNMYKSGKIASGTYFVPDWASAWCSPDPSPQIEGWAQNTLGTNIGNRVLMSSFSSPTGVVNSSNWLRHSEWAVRNSAGSGYLNVALHDGIGIDASFKTPGTDTKTWWDRQPMNDVQTWGHDNISYMTLNQGRLGIGITTPAARLDVQETDNTKMSFIARSAHSVDNTTCIYASVSRDLTQAFLVGQNNYGGVANNWKRTFMVYGNGKTLIGIRANGNPTHANAMLTVDGKIVSTEVVVTQQNWADFVFDKTYKLMPLNKVEEFYKENHHLPEVPNTKEIVENGNDLGKTDAILLQKIEELTLYIVEQQKQIDALSKKLKSQN